MVIPDGIGIKIALMLKGFKASRIPGIDFARQLLEQCAHEGKSVAIIGAKDYVVEKAVNNLKNEILFFSLNYLLKIYYVFLCLFQFFFFCLGFFSFHFQK